MTESQKEAKNDVKEENIKNSENQEESNENIEDATNETISDDVNAEIETLKKQCSEEKDHLVRLAAEYDNFRKRSQREKEAIYGDAKAKTITEILPVVDNFERAANNTDSSLEDYAKGVSMTFTQLMEILKKMNVEAYGESGEQFDPKIHSAVMHIEDEKLDENVITDVFQKGYRMGDRILRHAMVKVAN